MPNTPITLLPKIDLHRHLEGSVSPETMSHLYHKHHTAKKPIEHFQKMLTLTARTNSLDEFISKLATKFLKELIKTPEDLCFVFQETIKEAAGDHLSHLELRFTICNFINLHKDPLSLVKQLSDTITSTSRKNHLTTSFILGLKRGHPEKNNLDIARLAQKPYKQKLIAGVDLAGNEHMYPNHLFKPLAQAIHKAGIPFTVHAGEAMGAQSVKTAITLLGAHRIGHGVRAAEDEDVMQLIKKKNICLEICPTSNLHTNVYQKYSQVPLRTFIENVVPFTICTDDPVTSGITLSSEIQNLINHKLLTPKQYQQTLTTARKHTFSN